MCFHMLRKCKYQKDLIWFCPYLSTPLVLRYGLINPKNNCTFLGITTLNLLSQTELSSNTKHEAKHAVSLLSSLLKILEPVCDVLHFHDDKSQAETDVLTLYKNPFQIWPKKLIFPRCPGIAKWWIACQA